MRSAVELEVGAADLVMLVDFENAELFRADRSRARVARYVELSLGARLLAAVDNREGWTYHQALPPAYFTNVYDGFDELAGRLVCAPDRRRPRGVRRQRRRRRRPLRVFVSPFSSKYEPSPRYWSTLSQPRAGRTATRRRSSCSTVGPNADAPAVRAASLHVPPPRAQQPGVTHSLAALDEAVASPPRGVAELRRANVAVCADSFVAHAAPPPGCIDARRRERRARELARPQRPQLLLRRRPRRSATSCPRCARSSTCTASDPRRPRGRTSAGPSDRLARADDELGRAVANGAGNDELCRAYEHFTAAHTDVIARVAEWPPAAAPLAADYAYDLPARPLNDNGVVAAGLEPDHAPLRAATTGWFGATRTCGSTLTRACKRRAMSAPVAAALSARPAGRAPTSSPDGSSEPSTP